MTAPILQLLEVQPKARQVRPGAWVASCPAHEDSTPSLSWTTNGDGNVGVKCFAGCPAEAIVAALGEPMSSLFEPRPLNGHTNGHAPGVILRLEKPKPGGTVRTRRFEATDTSGRTWIHTRHEDATGRAVGDMKWQAGVKVATLLPFGSERIASWPAEDPIFLVEGEATAETLRARGLPALGTFGVQYKPDPAALASLTGRRVILWPDADDVGRAHMLDMARRLDGTAEALRWVEPPADVFKGWDAADADPETITRLVAEAGPVPFGPVAPGASIGTRTALDLRSGTAPAQLCHPFLTAEGPTVIYARGGTGKGMVACWFVKRLVAAGHVVMVVDFEGHEREWGSRLRGLGLTDDELARVHYRAPFASDWTAPTGSMASIADAIREDAARLGVTILIVDSYSVATSNGDTMGGEAAAREYFSGLARIGLPSLTIAHVRGDSGKFPDRPFGSVFVHNLARETWAVERLGDDEPEADADLIRVGPHIVALELRNKKANARPISAAQFVTFSFFGDGSIEVLTDRPSDRSVADRAAAVLADGPMTLVKIAAAIKEDTGETVSEDVLRRALNRDPRRFVHLDGTRPRPWGLR
jgi:hypothetical protein